MSRTRNIQHGKNDTNNDSAQRYIGSKTLDSLLHEGQSLFDLTTADGIKNAVHYFIEYHFQQVIESGQYRIANAEDHRVDNGELI